MLQGKIFACLLAGTLGTVAVGAPLGAAAGRNMDGRWAHTPLGRLVSGHVGRLLVLRSEMNLSEEQRARIKEVLVGHKPEITKAAKGVWEKRTSLREAVLDETADEAAIRKAADDLSKAIGDAAVLAARIRGQVAPVLNEEQKKLVKQCRMDCQQATEEFFEKAVQAP